MARVEAGRLDESILQSSRQGVMMAWTSAATMQVIKGDWILDDLESRFDLAIS